MLSNLTIRQKLLYAFSLIAIITIITSALAIYYTQKIAQLGKEVGVELAPLGDAAMEIKLTATTAHLWFEEIMSGDENEDIEHVWELLDKTLWYCDAILVGGKNEEGVFYKTENIEIRKTTEIVKLDVEKFIKSAHIRYETLINGNTNAANIGSEADQNFDKLFDEFIQKADETKKLIHDFMDESVSQLEKETALAINIMIFVGILVVVLAFLLATLITKDIINTLGGTMNEIIELVSSVSEGDLTIEIKNKGKNTGLMRSMEKMVENLIKLISDITNSAANLSSASKYISSNSAQLAQGANEQSSTTEDISSSVEEMLATINSNTEMAANTSKITTNSTKEMKLSNEIFVQTIDSISKINEKITIIAEIAEKTDILAINASIEASRAGEQGKGFAVVASEIRKLADKTKIASEEINKLSTSGQKISKIAGEKLNKLIPALIKSAEHVSNIVEANKDQATGVLEINNSIIQLSQVTNQNSASSEELSSSSEELSAQAELLKKIISVFKI